MIVFRQKEFTEYDAMRSLYVELLKKSDRNKFKVIDTSALIPILKGNNIVIERFVINTSMFRPDRFRMYIRIGAKAKLPDEVRLPGQVYDKKLLNLRLAAKGGGFLDAEISPILDLSVERTRLLGDAIKYDKKSRLLVLEFSTIWEAINALNILPFGLNYNIYLLDS